MIVCLALVIAIVAPAFFSRETGAGLTYTVTRNDLRVTVVEQGILESAENTEIKCKVRGLNTVIWVIDSGTMVQPGDELIRLDSRFIQEQIDERTKYAHWSVPEPNILRHAWRRPSSLSQSMSRGGMSRS